MDTYKLLSLSKDIFIKNIQLSTEKIKERIKNSLANNEFEKVKKDIVIIDDLQKNIQCIENIIGVFTDFKIDHNAPIIPNKERDFKHYSNEIIDLLRGRKHKVEKYDMEIFNLYELKNEVFNTIVNYLDLDDLTLLPNKKMLKWEYNFYKTISLLLRWEYIVFDNDNQLLLSDNFNNKEDIDNLDSYIKTTDDSDLPVEAPKDADILLIEYLKNYILVELIENKKLLKEYDEPGYYSTFFKIIKELIDLDGNTIYKYEEILVNQAYSASFYFGEEEAQIFVTDKFFVNNLFEAIEEDNFTAYYLFL